MFGGRARFACPPPLTFTWEHTGGQCSGMTPEGGLPEALFDSLPCSVHRFGDLRPGCALRTSLLDRRPLDLLQDLLHFGKGIEDHKRFVARSDTEHRPSVACQNFLRYTLDQPGMLEVVGYSGVHVAMLQADVELDQCTQAQLAIEGKSY